MTKQQQRRRKARLCWLVDRNNNDTSPHSAQKFAMSGGVAATSDGVNGNGNVAAGSAGTGRAHGGVDAKVTSKYWFEPASNFDSPIRPFPMPNSVSAVVGSSVGGGGGGGSSGKGGGNSSGGSSDGRAPTSPPIMSKTVPLREDKVLTARAFLSTTTAAASAPVPTMANAHETRESHYVPTRVIGTDGLYQRFMEALAVSLYVFGFVFAPFLLTLGALIVICVPPLWIFALPYVLWYIYDYRTPSRGSRPWLSFRQLSLWSYMAHYFPMTIVKTAELPPDRNYIIGAHPHGILSFATFLAFCTESVGFAELFPGLERRYAVTLPIQYWFPIRRELLMLQNTISSEVSAIEHVLKHSDKGTVVAIVPGGAAEALDATPDNFKLTLKNRKGFIKLALQNGASLVPMYHFGETSTYRQVPNPEGSRVRAIQNSMKSWAGFTMPFFYGCGIFNRYFGFMPYRTPINTVVGKPIIVDKIGEPTNAQINELHETYCRELSELFDAHKQKFGIAPLTKLEYV